MKRIEEIKELIKDREAVDILNLLSELDLKTTFSTSFGLEDQVISHMIFSNKMNIDVFTLDTGRMFPETYSVWRSTLERYSSKIKVYFPKYDAVQKMLETQGPSGFYESVENRKECCFIRKVEPLQRALKGYDVWITGIRAEQSGNRTGMEQLEWDESNKIIKIHPLLNWTFEEVKQFIKTYNIPYNSLHDKGFVSIGCQPCTRAIKEGEDFRAGRWWWEDNSKKECGLHVHNSLNSEVK